MNKFERWRVLRSAAETARPTGIVVGDLACSVELACGNTLKFVNRITGAWVGQVTATEAAELRDWLVDLLRELPE